MSLLFSACTTKPESVASMMQMRRDQPFFILSSQSDRLWFVNIVFGGLAGKYKCTCKPRTLLHFFHHGNWANKAGCKAPKNTFLVPTAAKAAQA